MSDNDATPVCWPIKWIVPRLDDWPKVAERDEISLRQTSLHDDDVLLRVAAFGQLIRLHGFIPLNAACGEQLLSNPDPEVRGTVYATFNAALQEGIEMQSTASRNIILRLARDEPCDLLRPWAMVLRHHLSDARLNTELDDILSRPFPAWSEPTTTSESRVQRVMYALAKKIVDGKPVYSVMF